MKTLRKLTMLAIMAVCAVCLVFGLVGCNGGEEEPPAPHEHTFAGGWTADGENGHYHLATCHDNVKSETEPHVDEDNDGKCDKCDYEMAEEPPAPHEHTFAEEWTADGENGHYHLATCHDNVKSETEPHEYNAEYKCTVCDYQHTHAFNMTEWAHDESNHWHASTCGHEVKSGEAPHVDEDDDQFCDECNEFVPHEHKYDETTWLYDEAKHWHPSTCHAEDPTVKGSEAEHVFTEGVCACGVKEEETEAYDVLTEKEIIDDDFYTWLTGIKADDVTEVRVTEQGDVIYYRDGEVEGVYIADRTVYVKAVDQDGEGLAEVWFKVAYEGNTPENARVLAVAQSNGEGIAELTFTPVGGYDSYKVMLAESKDVAALEGGEEAAIYVIPNRYLLKSTMGTGVVTEVEVCENDVSLEPVGTLEFEFSKSWEAYRTFGLPYARYYTDPLDESSEIIEENFDYTFTTSGDMLFDYFYFTPSNHYSFKGYEDATIEQRATIEQNYKFAASGIYEISFEVIDGSANVYLYYWNERGVEFTGAYMTESDGTPGDVYETSLSGAGIGDKYTGKDNVVVTVPAASGLRGYQLGLKTNEVCTVKLTVKRTGESEVPLQEITVGNNGDKAYILTENGETTQLKLVNVPAGKYSLQFNSTSPTGSKARFLRAYIHSASEASLLWDGKSYRGVIEVESNTEFIYVLNNSQDREFTVLLEKYDMPTINSGENNLYATSSRTDIMPNVKPFEYTVDNSFGESIVTVIATSYCVSNNLNDPYQLTISVNGNATAVTASSRGSGTETYTAFVTIKGGDKVTFSLPEPQFSVFMLKINIEKQKTAKLNEPFKLSKTSATYYYAFAADGAGTYKIKMNIDVMPTTMDENLNLCVKVSDANNPKRTITKTCTSSGETLPEGMPKYMERFDEFTMEEGEIIIFKIQITKFAASNVTFEFMKA